VFLNGIFPISFSLTKSFRNQIAIEQPTCASLYCSHAKQIRKKFYELK